MDSTEIKIQQITLGCRRRLWSLVLCAGMQSAAFADDNAPESEAQSSFSSATLYRSPEERREAGIGYQLTDWLKVSGLLEVEREEIDFKFMDLNNELSEISTVYTAQLGFELQFNDFASAEVIIEAEEDQGSTTVLDEAILVLEFDPFEVEIGRLSLPFGEYYSHFVTGPMLEFSETKVEGLVANYQINDLFELSGFVVDSRITGIAENSDIDWGVRLEFVNDRESVKVGIGYLSDLAESDENLLEDMLDEYQRSAAAVNIYALFGFEHFEITAEYSSALDNISGFDPQADKPEAANFEFSWFVSNQAQVSFRYEISSEFADNPKTRKGLNFNWLVVERLQLSVEYLQSDYRRDFVFDDDDNPLFSDEIIAARVTYEF